MKDKEENVEINTAFVDNEGRRVKAVVPKDGYEFIVYKRYLEPLSDNPSLLTQKMLYKGNDPEEVITMLKEGGYINELTANMKTLRSMMDYTKAQDINIREAPEFHYAIGLLKELGHIKITPMLINPDKLKDMVVADEEE